MQIIGTASNGNYIVEMSPDEWGRYAESIKTGVESLGSLVVAYRRNERLTQQGLADRVGISRNYLSQIERGNAENVSHKIYFDLLKEIAI